MEAPGLAGLKVPRATGLNRGRELTFPTFRALHVIVTLCWAWLARLSRCRHRTVPAGAGRLKQHSVVVSMESGQRLLSCPCSQF